VSEATVVAVALIAAVGPLFGIWVGWRLGRSERENQWRRDQQMEAYSELTAACADVAGAISVEMSAKTSDEHADARTEGNAAMLRFHNALHRNYIVASPAVRPVVDRLSRAMRAAIGEAQKSKRNDKVLSDHLVEAADLRKELSETAGNDLGFKRAGSPPH
jgi:hypothetical protein